MRRLVLLAVLTSACNNQAPPAGSAPSAPAAAPAAPEAAPAATPQAATPPAASAAPPSSAFDQLVLEKTGPAVSIRLGLVTITGDYPEAAVRKVFDDNLDKLRACYWTALKRDPKTAGRVAPLLTLAADGSVEKAENTATDLSDGKTVACFLAAMSAMKFPSPPAAGVTLKLPMVALPAP